MADDDPSLDGAIQSKEEVSDLLTATAKSHVFVAHFQALKVEFERCHQSSMGDK